MLSLAEFEEHCNSGKHFVIDSRKDYGSKTRIDGYRWKQQGKKYPRYKSASQKDEVSYLTSYYTFESAAGKEPLQSVIDDSQGSSSDSAPAHDQRMALHVFSLEPTGGHEPDQAIATLKRKTRKRSSPGTSAANA